MRCCQLTDGYLMNGALTRILTLLTDRGVVRTNVTTADDDILLMSAINARIVRDIINRLNKASPDYLQSHQIGP